MDIVFWQVKFYPCNERQGPRLCGEESYFCPDSSKQIEFANLLSIRILSKRTLRGIDNEAKDVLISDIK